MSTREELETRINKTLSFGTKARLVRTKYGNAVEYDFDEEAILMHDRLTKFHWEPEA